MTASTMTSAPAPCSPWAEHLMTSAAGGRPGQAALSPAEADRVQRHRDRLVAAWHAQDRVALLCAKQEVLDGAFCTASRRSAVAASDVPGSPALRRALRDLSWRMAGLLVPRGVHH